MPAFMNRPRLAVTAAACPRSGTLRHAGRTALAALLLLLAPLSAVRAEVYSFSGKKVQVQNLIGKAEVVAGTGSSITVEVLTGGKHAGEIEITREPGGEFEVLKIRYPGDEFVYPPIGPLSNTQITINKDGTFGQNSGRSFLKSRQVKIKGSGNGREMWADLRITLPKGSSLRLFNAVGGIFSTGTEAELLLDAASADVEVTRQSGPLSVDVGSGDVELHTVAGDVDVDTGSGDVDLTDLSGGDLAIDTGSGGITGVRLASGNVSMDTGSGDITLRSISARDLSLDTGSGSIEVELDGDLDRASFDTGSGDVSLQVGAAFGAELDIETGSGGIEVDAPHESYRTRRSEFSGKLGDGAGRVTIETGSGDVRILAAR